MTYCERLRVPLRWWLQGSALVASFWLAMVVAIPEPAAWGVTGGSMTLLVFGLWSYGHARVVIEDGLLRAGRAKIDVRLLGNVVALDEAATRDTFGPLADARAFLLMRPYLRRAVHLAIEDPSDPTPYWLVGSRRPERLAAAVNRMRGAPVEK